MVERCVMEAQLFMNKIKPRVVHTRKLWPDSFRCGLRHKGLSKNLSAAEKEIVFPNLTTRVIYLYAGHSKLKTNVIPSRISDQKAGETSVVKMPSKTLSS